MGRRLISKAFRVNAKAEILVNAAADRVGAIQVGFVTIGMHTTECVPVGLTGDPLQDRKSVVLTYPDDSTFTDGTDTADSTIAYVTRGRNGVETGEYSNRKQGLRGTYLSVPLLPSVTLCVTIGQTVEGVYSLELS